MRRLLLLHSPEDVEAVEALRRHLGPVCARHALQVSGSEVAVGEDRVRGLEQLIEQATRVVVIVTASLLAWPMWRSVAGPTLARKERSQVLVSKWSECLDTDDDHLRRFQPYEDPKAMKGSPNVDTALTALAGRVDDSLHRSVLGPSRFSLGNLPSPEEHIFGREQEWAELDAALDDPKNYVAIVVGEGGAGKTQLVRTWLDRLKPAYGGADAVISCSVEDQGEQGSLGASGAAGLLLAALGGAPSQDPMGTVAELVDRIRARRTIVVIDGLERLQDSSGAITDRPVRTLIRELASWMGEGLLLITTRPPFTELGSLSGVRRIDLGPLDRPSAERVLRSRGVRGPPEQLRRVYEQLRGHALLLALVAGCLADSHDGDAMMFNGFDLGARDIDEKGRLERILSAYEQQLSPEERSVLGLVALCERPATIDMLASFTAMESLTGFASAMCRLPLPDLRRALARLQRAALLSKVSSTAISAFEPHPLVRGWWRARLATIDPAGVRSAHDHLFDRYRELAPPAHEAIRRREDLEPLHAAVTHGVQAGRWRDAFDVLRGRIREGDLHTSLKKYGTVAEDLRAFLSFFDRNRLGVRADADLEAWQRHWLENSAGVLFRAQGRATEAADLLRRAVRTAAGASLFAESAESARNLASAHSLMGDLVGAFECCQRAIEHADRSGETRQRLIARDFGAHLLHRFGKLHEARAAFEEIEQIRDREGDGKIGVAHYPFASQSTLLIDLDELDLALDRARRAVDLTHGGDPDAASLLNQGLARRSFARALAALDNLDAAAESFEQAYNLIRQSGRYDHLAPCHIDLATFWSEKDRPRARRHLAEARRIFEGRGFRLIEADFALTSARVAILDGDPARVDVQLDDAEQLVRDTGYGLRLPRLYLLRAQLAALVGDVVGARASAELAGQRAREMGQRRRDIWRDIEALLDRALP